MSRTAVIALLLATAVLAGLWLRIRRFEDEPAIAITASHAVEQSIPIFAQFIVTQRLTLAEPTDVTRLVVPMLAPAGARSLLVKFSRQGQMIAQWYGPTESRPLGEGIVEAVFVFPQPRLLSGAIEVSFAAPRLTHDQQEQAPRLFIETAGDRYPDGNYRVAENEKNGDVNLLVMHRVSGWDLFQRTWQQHPVGAAVLTGRWLVVVILLISLPFVLERAVRPADPKLQP